jgi:Ca2+/H+ antiporter, TMEM165/GDT1 family
MCEPSPRFSTWQDLASPLGIAIYSSMYADLPACCPVDLQLAEACKMTGWTQSGPAIGASFLSSAVEFVEALTIVLAVGVTRGWRAAWIGAISAAALLTGLVMFFGKALEQIPLATLQLVVGLFLLLFGMRWLRKAVLRSAGVIRLHDESKVFAEETQMLKTFGAVHGVIDLVGFTAAFKAVLLEGLEVVFIVIAVGTAAKNLPAASAGAIAAGVVVALIGVIVRRPLTRVPENSLKFSVGVLLSAFGTFWTGEGLHIAWPGENWAILGLIGAFLAVAWLSIRIAKQNSVLQARRTPS